MASFRRKVELQRHTNDLAVDAVQLDLLAKKPEPMALDIDAIRRQPTIGHAINLCIISSGLERKEVFDPLKMDAALLSRIETGKAYFPAPKLNGLMDLCNNEAPLIWLSESRGYDFESMRKHRNDNERRIAELEQENGDLRRAFRLMIEGKK